MTDWRTIRIPEEDFERHNERRQELGVTWAEYIDGEAPEYTYLKETQTVSPDELREIVREETRRALTDYTVAEMEIRQAVRDAIADAAR